MEKIKNLVTVLAVAFGLSFMTGFFDIDASEGFYIFIGLVELAVVIWLLILVNKKK